uniref:Potassium channel domain-containing protein n=1 Tax=Anopheles epiroticus TaxID=199890 RepID=A0A182PAA6_9DIPT
MSIATMHEKDGHDHYRYDTYAPLMKSATMKGVKAVHCTSETATVLKGGTHATMTKHSTTVHSKDGKAKSRCCSCCAGRSSSTFWAALLTNIGICTLLLAYTLLGSFIFLAIEGGASQMQQRTLATRHQKQLPANNNHHGRPDTANLTFPQLILLEAVEARQKTVENIWDITVSLNILYRENWTRLASMEIARFQEQFVNRLLEEMTQINNMQHAVAAGGGGHDPGHGQDNNWTFARAFLYSLTILTTIGYGSVAPRTVLGRMITLAYAVLGIPLTLVYLSSTGGMLAKVARGVFSRVLCCCLCSNCGYCCYDEKRMEEKEKRMKRKRQQMELQQQQQHLALSGQEPYYVRSGSLQNSVNSPEKQLTMLGPAVTTPDLDSTAGSSDSESRASMHGLSILAPILLCVAMMSIYIVVGALTLFRLESLPLSDGVYFCFMALSTIGFGTLAPGTRRESTATTWFCSGYIMAGMALTAMCFNVLHDEILHRLRHMKNTNLYQRNPTEETLITGTPTSVIFAQEPDLGQLHLQHDCHTVHHTVGHELIPIVTMAPNGPSPGLSSELLDRSTALSDVGPVGSQSLAMHPVGEQTASHGLGMAGSGIGSIMTSNLNTGVYTLPEESEHESEECPAM